MPLAYRLLLYQVMKTLLVKDELFIRLDYEYQLRSLGWEYASCTTAEAALDAYHQMFYPLILTDVGLPGMDGIAFCRRIRTLPHGVNSIIVMISGSNTPENIQTALAAGADEFLPKPVNLRTFQPHVAALIQKRSISEYITNEKERSVCKGLPMDLSYNAITPNRY